MQNIDVLTDHAVEWVQLAKSKSNYGYNVNNLSEDDMKDFLSRIKAVTNLPDTHTSKVIDLMREKYDSSRWGLINSITEVAQDFSLERRLDLEAIAGNLLVG